MKVELMRFRVYGKEGHRQRESFFPSSINDFSRDGKVRIIELLNSDKTGTNEYSEVVIVANNLCGCVSELVGQIEDGIFENSKVGRVECFNDFSKEWFLLD